MDKFDRNSSRAHAHKTGSCESIQKMVDMSSIEGKYQLFLNLVV